MTYFHHMSVLKETYIATGDGVDDETFGINYPRVIMHKRDDEVFIHPSGINQQLYFFNEDTNSLYEKYQVNTVFT